MTVPGKVEFTGRMIVHLGGREYGQWFGSVNDVAVTDDGIYWSLTTSGSGNPNHSERLAWGQVVALSAQRFTDRKGHFVVRYDGAHGASQLAVRTRPDRFKGAVIIAYQHIPDRILTEPRRYWLGDL